MENIKQNEIIDKSMWTLLRSRLFLILLLPALLVAFTAGASHLAGGKMTYRYLGTSAGYAQYEVTLKLYEDCLNGQPDAIAADNPVFLAAYDMTNYNLVSMDTNINFTQGIIVPDSSVNPCALPSVSLCLLEKTFVQTFSLPVNNHGYVISYQRCCLSGTLLNILNSSSAGITYYCIIPPAIQNNSAVFKHYGNRIGCINSPLNMDLSATDADGDSLSYEFTNSLSGAGESNVKPLPLPPPFDSTAYLPPATESNPMGIAHGMVIDPRSGVLTCVPDRIGSFMLAVNCIEWRGGIIINKTYQQFEVTITNCAGKWPFSAGADTVVTKGSSVQFHATGGISYTWTPDYNLTDTTISNPVGYYPSDGIYKYAVSIATAAGCEGVDTLTVRVQDNSALVMPNAFTPNNDGVNDVFAPSFIGKCDLKYIKVFNRYGNLVYNGTDGWDGNYNGKRQGMGVYFWELLYENNLGQAIKMKGNVTLVR